jgi:hypothetical protein
MGCVGGTPHERFSSLIVTTDLGLLYFLDYFQLKAKNKAVDYVVFLPLFLI